MVVHVIGGAGSGKSAYAEEVCLRLGGQRVYLATMEASDEESKQRIKRHQKLRLGKDFCTVECPRQVGRAAVPEGSTVLLECLGNLVANELFSKGTSESERAFLGVTQRKMQEILQNLMGLREKCRHLVIVSNQVFSDGQAYDAYSEAYRQCLASLNAALAAEADEVVEVVCGIPLHLKEEVHEAAL